MYCFNANKIIAVLIINLIIFLKATVVNASKIKVYKYYFASPKFKTIYNGLRMHVFYIVLHIK